MSRGRGHGGGGRLRVQQAGPRGTRGLRCGLPGAAPPGERRSLARCLGEGRGADAPFPAAGLGAPSRPAFVLAVTVSVCFGGRSR